MFSPCLGQLPRSNLLIAASPSVFRGTTMPQSHLASCIREGNHSQLGGSPGGQMEGWRVLDTATILSGSQGLLGGRTPTLLNTPHLGKV